VGTRKIVRRERDGSIFQEDETGNK